MPSTNDEELNRKLEQNGKYLSILVRIMLMVWVVGAILQFSGSAVIWSNNGCH